MLRVISDARPAWVVAENVPGLKSMGLDSVLSDLEDQGYTCGAYIVPALAVGAPHRRDRLWIIAHRDGEWEQQPQGQQPQSWGWAGNCGKNAGHSNGKRRQECHAPAQPGWAGQLAGRADQERGSGCETKPGILRMADGIPAWLDESGGYPVSPTIPKSQKPAGYTSRIKALGNSIHPEIAYHIFSAIKSAEAGCANPVV